MCVMFSLLAVKASVDALEHHLEHELLLNPYLLNLNLKAEICSIMFQDSVLLVGKSGIARSSANIIYISSCDSYT